MTRSVLAGVLVGGASSRMHGSPKGLLPSPDGAPIVQRTCTILGVLRIPCVLVGRSAAYATLGLTELDDEPAGIGPLGGLIALLRRAGDGWAVAIACDMPLVTPALVGRLVGAPDAAAVAPKIGGVWQPMFARYDAKLALPIAVRRAGEGRRSLQGLLDELGARELELAPGEERALVDWDTPSDMELS